MLGSSNAIGIEEQQLTTKHSIFENPEVLVINHSKGGSHSKIMQRGCFCYQHIYPTRNNEHFVIYCGPNEFDNLRYDAWITKHFEAIIRARKITGCHNSQLTVVLCNARGKDPTLHEGQHVYLRKLKRRLEAENLCVLDVYSDLPEELKKTENYFGKKDQREKSYLHISPAVRAYVHEAIGKRLQDSFDFLTKPKQSEEKMVVDTSFPPPPVVPMPNPFAQNPPPSTIPENNERAEPKSICYMGCKDHENSNCPVAVSNGDLITF